MTKKDNWNYKQGATNTIEGATHVKKYSKFGKGKIEKNMGQLPQSSLDSWFFAPLSLFYLKK